MDPNPLADAARVLPASASLDRWPHPRQRELRPNAVRRGRTTRSCATGVVGLLVLSVPRPSAQPALTVFFGNLHSHTSYSDGSGTPEVAYRHAKETADLDFLAISEHNHALAENGAAADRKDGILIAKNPALYNGNQADALISTATRWNVDGEFVALYGQEFSSIGPGNHVNVFEVPRVIDVSNGRFDLLVRNWIPNNRDSANQHAVVQFNHPSAPSSPDAKEYGRDDFGSVSNWIREMGAVASLIEILNGPALTDETGLRAGERMEGDFLEYLNEGFHLAPTGNQDNHYFTWGTTTDVRTGVVTDALTKTKILTALRNRHVYATEDKNLRLIFRVNGQLIGSRISPTPAANSELTIEFSLTDDDEPDATYEIQVLSDVVGGGSAEESEVVEIEGNTTKGSIADIRYSGGHQYFLFKIRQFAEHGPADLAWTAPVWFEPGGGPSPTPTEPASDAFVASKNSEIYHVSLECRSAQQIKQQNRIVGATAKQGRREHDRCPRR